MLVLIETFSAHGRPKTSYLPMRARGIRFFHGRSVVFFAHDGQISPMGKHMAHLPMDRPSIILA
jgi:hypothetical protein